MKPDSEIQGIGAGKRDKIFVASFNYVVVECVGNDQVIFAHCAK